MTLKEEFLALLEKDKEFRYAVVGLLGFEEILRRLDKHEEELVKLREDLNRLGGTCSSDSKDMMKSWLN
jgi:hypothetical protein